LINAKHHLSNIENVCKNGFISEKQRYKCKKCGYNFTTGRPSKPLHLKRLALELYLEELSLDIGVSTETI
jgi:transposase